MDKWTTTKFTNMFAKLSDNELDGLVLNSKKAMLASMDKSPTMWETHRQLKSILEDEIYKRLDEPSFEFIDNM